jgi:hypothetical protein
MSAVSPKAEVNSEHWHPRHGPFRVDGAAAHAIQAPKPRTLTEPKANPKIANEIEAYLVALIELPAGAHAAA